MRDPEALAASSSIRRMSLTARLWDDGCGPFSSCAAGVSLEHGNAPTSA